MLDDPPVRFLEEVCPGGYDLPFVESQGFPVPFHPNHLNFSPLQSGQYFVLALYCGYVWYEGNFDHSSKVYSFQHFVQYARGFKRSNLRFIIALIHLPNVHIDDPLLGAGHLRSARSILSTAIMFTSVFYLVIYQ